MPNLLQGGFHADQELRSRARRYNVVSNNSTAIFRGDVLKIATTGLVDVAAAGDTDLIGVAKEFEYTTGGKRVRSPYLPASTTYTGNLVSTQTWVWIYDDPNQEFWTTSATNTSTDTAAEWEAAVGSNMDLLAGAGSTVYGCSGHQVDGTPVAGAAQFRILEIRRVPGRTYTGANLHVKVMINEGFHAFVDNAGI